MRRYVAAGAVPGQPCVPTAMPPRPLPPLQATIDHRMVKERELEHERDQMSRRRDEDNRRKALEDERVKVAIRKQAGASLARV